jgi:hypothetical protein
MGVSLQHKPPAAKAEPFSGRYGTTEVVQAPLSQARLCQASALVRRDRQGRLSLRGLGAAMAWISRWPFSASSASSFVSLFGIFEVFVLPLGLAQGVCTPVPPSAGVRFHT